MKPDKSMEEALLRSHQATEKANQEQSKLHNMSNASENPEAQQSDASQPKLHETPRNLIQSWDTLRQMDEELEAKKAKNEHNTDNEPKV
jgi:hypothetical protein